MHKEQGSWDVELEGADQLVCGKVVPRGPGRDLHIARHMPLCRPPISLLKCTQYYDEGAYLVAKERPRTCSTVKPDQAHYQGSFLFSIRWRHWGHRRARATAVIHENMGGRVPARLTAYRRREDCAGDRVYTRLRVQTEYGHQIKRYSPAC